jgi:6-pyruvoyltetrahydropterin/6-carboxytetrahydropterin synthase
MYKLKIKHHFDASHFLPYYNGKCQNMHGHRWEIIVEVWAKELDKQGFVVDFGSIKEIINQYDHICLNDKTEYKDIQPTAENISRFIYQKIKNLTTKIKKIKVTVLKHQIIQ